MAIELTTEGYINLGTEAAVAEVQARAAILDIIPSTEENAKKQDEILEAAEVRRSTGQKVLKELQAEGAIMRLGKGRKNDPYLYWMPSEKLSATSSSSIAAERNGVVDSDIGDGARA